MKSYTANGIHIIISREVDCEAFSMRLTGADLGQRLSITAVNPI